MLEVDIKGSRGGFDLDVTARFPVGVNALIGPSGAGKSSLLRMIAGLDRPENGEISLAGKSWFSSTQATFLPTRRRQIGMVFQSGLLLWHRSVMDNIVLGARGHPVSAQLLERTGCDRLVERPVGGLSGGEQQRVMLARALAGQPDLLLLDEPLSALDPVSREQILDLMGGLFPGLEIPVIYVTHAFEEAARLTSRFFRMEGGRIAASGSATDVLSGFGIAAQEQAVSSIMEGVVASLEGGGVARVQVGQQFVQVQRGDLVTGQRVYLRLWARDIILAHNRPEGISARNLLVGRIEGLASMANGQVLVDVRVGETLVRSLVLSRTAREMKLQDGMAIFVIFKSASIEPVRPPVNLHA